MDFLVYVLFMFCGMTVGAFCGFLIWQRISKLRDELASGDISVRESAVGVLEWIVLIGVVVYLIGKNS